MMPLREIAIVHSSRIGLMLTAACLGCGCSRSGSDALASSVAPLQTAGALPATPQETITLVFDLPADYSARASDGALAIVGFQVGLFKPGEATRPLKLVDLARDAVSVQGSSARVTFRPGGLPAGENTVVLRLRTVSRGQPSDWSEPTASAIAVPLAAAPTKRASSNTRKKRAPDAPKAALGHHPALKTALGSVVGPGCQLEDAVAAFRNMRSLATAVALSQRQTAKFVELCRAVQGPPQVSLRDAVRRLYPSADARQVLRGAQAEGRKLLAATKPNP